MIHIGIDTGVKTGFASWDSEKRHFLEIVTLTITQAMEKVLIYRNFGLTTGSEIRLYIEDARLRKWFGNTGREKLQGAGSVKRDAHIWQDWCREHEIDCLMVAPKNNKTKMNSESFKRLTGWRKAVSEHARDAACMVYGR